MKATGIVRKIDELGRIVIPKEIRRSFGIQEGEPLEVFTGTGNQIILQKYSPGCQECGDAGVELFGDKVKLCNPCLNKLCFSL